MASPEHSTPVLCTLCHYAERADAPAGGGVLCALCVRLLERTIHLSLFLDQPGISQQRIALWPVVSENISAAGWRAHGDTGSLVVQFKGNATAFRYSNVGRAWWLAFWAAPSKGSFFHSTVRADAAAHPFTKL